MNFTKRKWKDVPIDIWYSTLKYLKATDSSFGTHCYDWTIELNGEIYRVTWLDNMDEPIGVEMLLWSAE